MSANEVLSSPNESMATDDVPTIDLTVDESYENSETKESVSSGSGITTRLPSLRDLPSPKIRHDLIQNGNTVNEPMSSPLKISTQDDNGDRKRKLSLTEQEDGKHLFKRTDSKDPDQEVITLSDDEKDLLRKEGILDLTVEVDETENKERFFRNAFDSLQTNSAILQRKLVRREKEVMDAERKWSLLVRSSQNNVSQVSRTQEILAEEANSNLKRLRLKRRNTKLKLEEVKKRMHDFANKWNSFIEEKKTSELQQPLIEDGESTVRSRNNLLRQKEKIAQMLREGTLSTNAFNEIDGQLNKRLDGLHVNHSAKESSSEVYTLNLHRKVDLFAKSVDTAKELLNKNTSRTELTKRSLYQQLDIIRRYRDHFERGRACDISMRNNCREAAEILFQNGVKMPLVYETLQDYGIQFKNSSILSVDRRAQYFKSLEVAQELVRNSTRHFTVKAKIVDSLNILQSLRQYIDSGLPPTPAFRYQAAVAAVELQEQGLKMDKLYENVRKYGVVTTRDELNLLKSSQADGEETADLPIPYEHPLINGRRQDTIQVANIHSSEDQEDIRALLENIKQDEHEIEGETLTPEELTVNLLKHQRVGLQWLLNVETSKKKGGILADDMGLGKTVQALALMISHRSKDEDCKTNLIVAPVSILRSWQGEMETKIKRSANFKCFIYGGSSGNKVSSWKSLSKYDAVMISYQTLAIEYKKHWPLKLIGDQKNLPPVPQLEALNSLKQRNEYWSPFYCNESNFYRVVLDEGQNIKNKNTKAAKACCTVRSTYRWILSGTPIQNNMSELYSLIRFLRIPPYHREERFNADIGRPLSSNRNSEYDSEDRKRTIKKVRVLLKAIMLRRSKTDKIDGEAILELPPKEVEIKEAQLQGEELAFYANLENKNQKLAQKLLERKARGNYSNVLTLLLRLRQACCHPELVIAGEKKAEGTKVANGKSFENDWLRLYNRIRKMTPEEQETVTKSMDLMICFWCNEQLEPESSCVLTGCGHLLCEACVEPFVEEASSAPTAIKIDNGILRIPCKKCQELTMETEIVSFNLYDQVINQGFTEQMLLVEFQSEMEGQRHRAQNAYTPDLNKLEPSTKMLQCMDVIKDVVNKSDTEKILVFSQFTAFFDLFEHFLSRDLDIPFLKYTGSMNAEQRSDVINRFYREKDKRVLLISMKAGNSGLTLTCANHVVIVDPFWNPYVEEQAQDRCYRISQTKEVHVHRLFIKNSVEDRIAELQKRKRELVDAAMNASNMDSINRLGVRELGFLFGLNSLQ